MSKTDRNADRGVQAPVLVLTGPTASGKSDLALALAGEFGGAVINGDSLQVYQELEILTARPGPTDLAKVPHRLYGVLPGRERCSVGRWRDLAVAEIDRAHGAGQLPIVVGGTGLYLKALEHGLATVPPIPPQVRAAASARHGTLGGPAFHAALAERDPGSAGRIHASDRQRLIRAWEVLEATGRPLSAWQAQDLGQDTGPYRFHRLCLIPPRDTLYAACNGRFLAMMERGALDEVARLLALDLDPGLPIMKALGVPQLAAHLRGEISLDQAIAGAQGSTRRYAKRQLTWLRTQGPKDLDQGGSAAIIGNKTAQTTIEAQLSESFNFKIFNIIRDFRLTESG
jgi:tRNA dimethylallyltransferase